jgi:putative redox protein
MRLAIQPPFTGLLAPTDKVANAVVPVKFTTIDDPIRPCVGLIMDAAVVWKGGLSFAGSGAAGGLTVPLSSSDDETGSPGFSPMQILLVALGGCSGMDVISILRKKRQEVSGFEVRVHGERSDAHPKVYTGIIVEYILTGHSLDPAAVQRAVELSQGKYCSVMAMLGKTASIETKIMIRET